MAIVTLAPGVDASRCPKCGSEMTIPWQGRRESTRDKWFRHCRNQPSCGITTVTTETPAFVRPPLQLPITLPTMLPFKGDH